MSANVQYLYDVATILKMTTYFENKLEEKRLRLNKFILFNVQSIFEACSIEGNGITSRLLMNLAHTFMERITQVESDYFIQLYSDTGKNITLEDLVQMLSPKTIHGTRQDNTNKKIEKEVAFENLKQFWSYVRLELEFYRKSEPLKSQMFVKYKEDGEQFAKILATYDTGFTSQKMIDFMHSQRYYFTQDDFAALSRRIQPQSFQQKLINYNDFYVHCPLIPYRTALSRDPTYKLVSRQEIISIPKIDRDPEINMKQLKRQQSYIPLKPYSYDVDNFYVAERTNNPQKNKITQIDEQIKYQPIDVTNCNKKAQIGMDPQGSTRSFFYPEGKIKTSSQVHIKYEYQDDNNKQEIVQNQNVQFQRYQSYYQLDTDPQGNTRNFFFRDAVNGNQKYTDIKNNDYQYTQEKNDNVDLYAITSNLDLFFRQDKNYSTPTKIQIVDDDFGKDYIGGNFENKTINKFDTFKEINDSRIYKSSSQFFKPSSKTYKASDDYQIQEN